MERPQDRPQVQCDLLEGDSRNLENLVSSWAWFNVGKRIQIKISSEKRRLGEAVQGRTCAQASTFLLPVTSHGAPNSPRMMSESRALLTLREAHPDLAVQAFYLRVTLNGSTHKIDLTYSVLAYWGSDWCSKAQSFTNVVPIWEITWDISKAQRSSSRSWSRASPNDLCNVKIWATQAC